MKVLNKVLSRRTLFLSEFVIFANPCLEEAEENVKRFMCKLNEMSTKKLSIKELLQSGDCDKEVEISGWVRTKRGNKQVNFIALNDGSTINNIQIVVDMNNISEELMKKVTTGAAIHVKGLLVKSEGSGQSHEIQRQSPKGGEQSARCAKNAGLYRRLNDKPHTMRYNKDITRAGKPSSEGGGL